MENFPSVSLPFENNKKGMDFLIQVHAFSVSGARSMQRMYGTVKPASYCFSAISFRTPASFTHTQKSSMARESSSQVG